MDTNPFQWCQPFSLSLSRAEKVCCLSATWLCDIYATITRGCMHIIFTVFEKILNKFKLSASSCTWNSLKLLYNHSNPSQKFFTFMPKLRVLYVTSEKLWVSINWFYCTILLQMSHLWSVLVLLFLFWTENNILLLYSLDSFNPICIFAKSNKKHSSKELWLWLGYIPTVLQLIS